MRTREIIEMETDGAGALVPSEPEDRQTRAWQLHFKGQNITQIARALKVSRPTVYK